MTLRPGISRHQSTYPRCIPGLLKSQLAKYIPFAIVWRHIGCYVMSRVGERNKRGRLRVIRCNYRQKQEGNVFRNVCQSSCPGADCLPLGGSAFGRGSASRGVRLKVCLQGGLFPGRGGGLCLQGVGLQGGLPNLPVLISSDGHCCDRYVYYGNAFLFLLFSHSVPSQLISKYACTDILIH